MGDFYEVEQIVDRKIGKNGKMMYFVKWKDWDESTNTWEPEEHLTLTKTVAKLLAEFNASRDEKNTSQRSGGGGSAKRKSKSTSLPRKNSKTNNKVSFEVAIPQQCGFDRGYTPEKIVGAKNTGDAVEFLIKWKDSNDPELISREQAKTHCPQLVIQFYEQNIMWDED